MQILNTIYNGISAFTSWAWSLPILIVLIGGGIWLTIACDFIQFKHFGTMMKMTAGESLKKKTSTDGNTITGFQALTTALAATLGTGNIVGVGTAIATGGPGAVFWMWVIGMVAMALKYAEATLSVHTRIPDGKGGYKGGAPHYLATIWKPMGFVWALCMTVNMLIAAGVHTGSVVSAGASLSVPTMVSTGIVAVLVAAIMLGGLTMLVKVTEKLVPFMALLYVGAGLIVIVLNIGNLIPAIASIFTGAFTGSAAVGGFLGATVSAAIKNGCARGMYSSDAGNGQSSMVYAQTDVDDPVKQGMWGAFEVFVDTIVVCTFTALVILCTGVWTTGDPGSVLAINAFTQSLGIVGRIISALGLLLFAGSTLLAFCTYAGMIAEELFGKIARYVVQVVFVIMTVVGGTVGVDSMLLWSDFGNVFTISLNVLGMLIMTKTLHNLTVSFFKTGRSTLE